MPERILFVALTNDAGSDRIVIEAGARDASCAVLAPPGAFASLPRCVSARFPLTTRFGCLGSHLRFAALFRRTVADWAPDLVVPLDDLSATLLRLLGRDRREPLRLRTLIERSLGSPTGYEAACGRVRLMEAAARAGVRTPMFAADRPGARSTRVGLPLMVKRDQSSGSGGVVRVETEAALGPALRAARLKTLAKTVVGRLGGFRRPSSPVLLQGVVEGSLAMFTAACRDGRMIDGFGMEAVEVHPTKRASTVLRRLDNPEMAETAGALVAALGCSGFVSFDFIVDPSQRAFLIEMNPRPIGSSHLGHLFGHDLMDAFLYSEARRQAPVLAPDTLVALFPKEPERNPDSPYLTSDDILFDVPEDEPALIEAYLAHLAMLHPTHAGLLQRLLRPAPVWAEPAHARAPWLANLPLAS